MSGADPILVGIDIGTTNLKAVAIDRDCRVLGVQRRPMVIHTPAPGAAEFDLAALALSVEGVLAATATGLEAAGHDPRRIAVVAVAAIGESFVGLDRDFQPALPCPTWYDRRTAPFRAEAGLSRAGWFDTTGMVDDDIYTIWRLVWWRRTQPDAVACVRHWFSVADYALFLLGGTPVAHPSLAARTGLADRNRLDWSDDHLALAGIDRDMMPALAAQATAAGRIAPATAARLGISADVLLVNAGHDHPCAGLGSGMIAPGQFVNSAGTAESLISLVDHPLSHAEAGGGEYDCYPHSVPGQFLLSGHTPTSGAAIDWVARRLGLTDGDTAAAAIPPGAGGVRVAPYLQGSGSPWNRRDARLRLDGADLATGPAEVMRATYEGLAAWLAVNVARFELYTRESPADLLLTGGGGRYQEYARIKAALLNRTLIVADEAEAAGIGAAMVGGLAAGIWQSVGEMTARPVPQTHRITPDPDLRAAYAGLAADLMAFVTP